MVPENHLPGWTDLWTAAKTQRLGQSVTSPQYPTPRQLYDPSARGPWGVAAGRVGWCEVCRVSQKWWEQCPWAQWHLPPLLERTFTCSWFLMEPASGGAGASQTGFPMQSHSLAWGVCHVLVGCKTLWWSFPLEVWFTRAMCDRKLLWIITMQRRGTTGEQI